MYLCILTDADTPVLFSLSKSFYLCRLPEFFGYDSLMYTICKKEIFLCYKVIVVSCAVLFLGLSAAVSDLSAVYGILDYLADKSGVKQWIFTILPLYLADAVILEIFCESVCSYICIYILIEDHSDSLGLFLIDFKITVYQLIAVGRKAAVPFAFTSLLNTTLHSLDSDVLSFNLSNG